MPRTTQHATGSMQRIRDADFGYEQARQLLLRAGFGGPPDQIRTLASVGPEKAVDILLEVERAPYEDDSDQFRNDIIATLSAAEREEYRRAQRRGDEDTLARFRLRQQMQERDDRQQIARMQRWWLARMIETPRPLEEKMTLFWHGHFASSHRKVENSAQMLAQNQLFRRHAIGDFSRLLFGIVRDPAMLAYLDNRNSNKQRPNENLARELMELFSLGEGEYSEEDIREGARALTGYSYEGAEFVFLPDRHDGGGKTILGRSGPFDGEGFVQAILEQPACPRFIAAKLYRFFVNHDLPQDLRDAPAPVQQAVRTIASDLRAADYNVRPALRRLFLSQHFYDPANASCQIKSPAELVVGAVRMLNTPVRDLGVLNDAMDRMGQALFFPPSVAGWDGGRTWINTSTLFVRQNILVYLLTGRTPVGIDALANTQRYDPTPLLDDLARHAPGAERDAARVSEYLVRLTLGEAGAPRAAEFARFVEERGGVVTPDIVTALLVLASAAPEYQLA